MSGRRAAFIHSDQIEQYRYPEGCPFRPERAGRLRRVLLSMGLLSGPGVSEVAPVAADRRALKLFHSARYLHVLKKADQGQWDIQALQMGIGTDDVPVFRGMYDYAVLATGATLVGADLILSGQVDVAFNPSGGYHHAFPEKAAGFCYINDNAIACSVLAEAGRRVLYLDVDVHNGDGVAHAFYDRSDVMTISMHENPKMLFPGTGFEDEIGEGPGKGYCVNLPLPVGTYDRAYLDAFESVVLPLIGVFDPDVIVFELGVDALAGDPLAHLHLTNNTYVEIIRHLLNFGKPILATGGGGYNVENSVRAWALAWTVFTGEDDGPDLGPLMGGVMMQSTDWQGGLRDRELVVTEEQRQAVLPALMASIDIVKAKVFPIHGL
ncbi:MAG TPA: acetoin utilization protein AcuC [Sedimentisphaerales bacterium]|nr:acetoin utilization protein AcuC [Sedimentisphaerales bacterium]HRS09565.1 acetoin utilization protein AcuC [Sedimentisphaerales bacterium]HRS09580.1 acetoin utilization protein AcuC [Sedimentisphaerales bacterium]HRV46262.1 acetoin utilization protein AcuC [Sedimentisphaerales bacterium]